MKRLVTLGALALLVFVGCGNPTSPEEPGAFGAELALEGRIYKKVSAGEGWYTYDEPDETSGIVRAVNTGETGALTGGKFNFTVTTPSVLAPLNAEGLTTLPRYELSVSPESVNYAQLALTVGDDTLKQEAIKEGVSEEVLYWYVDANVTLKDKGGKKEQAGYTYTYDNSSIDLKAGWNIVYIKVSTEGKTIKHSFSSPRTTDVPWVLVRE
jgi:hypothetical protein